MNKLSAAKWIAFFAVLLLNLSIAPSAFANTRSGPVFLISIDGMRNDYLELHRPPTLTRLASEGVRAQYMQPVYPSKTFPNHYSVVTGLYPRHHGIIENNMYDTERKKVFGLHDRTAVIDPAWWSGEPIWNTASKAGLVSAAYFYPGSETPIGGGMPDHWQAYEHTRPHDTRIKTILGWFDLPVAERPAIVTMYFADVDDAGHAHGPEAAETRAALHKVDASIDSLIKGLEDRGITATFVLFSDHGMSPYKMRDAIVLDDHFDKNDAERIFWSGEFVQIFPKPGRTEVVYDAIRTHLPRNAHIYRPGDFPSRFKLNGAKRLAPITVVPDPGTIITNRERYDRATREGLLDKTRGGHGYDNRHPTMRATFIAIGPKLKEGFITKPFESVDVYNLLCRLLEIEPAKNDGKWKRIRGVLKK